MNWHINFLASGCLAAAAMAQAQDEVTEVIYVVTSRLQATPEAQTFDLLTLSETTLRLYAGLADALSETPGVYVQAPGGRSGFASVFLAGADPNFTTVMLDGIPLNDSTNTRGGAVNVAELETETFSRVEIADGSFSSLYGSGALAGAINLVVPGGSRSATGRGALSLGDQKDYSGFARLQAPLTSSLGGSLSISMVDDGEGAADSEFSAESATVKIAPFDRTDAGSILLRVSQTEASSFPDSSGGDRYAIRQELEHRQNQELLFGIDYPLVFATGLRLDLNGSVLRRDNETESPGVAPSAINPVGIPAGSDDTRYTRSRAQAVARIDLAGWEFLFGGEYQAESGRSEGELDFFGTIVPSGFELTRATTSAFAESRREYANWTLNASVRLDHVDELGNEPTARGSVRYDIPGSNVSIRAAVGSGFKAPSLYALGNPFVGNPDLKPEKSRSWRTGIEWSLDADSSLALMLFQTRYTDLVDFVAGPPPRLENRAAVVSEGISIQLVQEFRQRNTVSAYVQYADTRDQESNEELNDRPAWRAGASVRWQLSDNVALTGRYAYVGARNSYSIPTGPERLDPFGTVGADIAWYFQPSYALRLTLDNVLDTSYEHAVGFTSPGRRVRLTVARDF